MITPFKSEMAQEVQVKYQFYFVALAFTFLGLSLHSADLDTYTCLAIKFELGGWILLCIAGLSGLLKINIWYHLLYSISQFEGFLKKSIEVKSDIDKCESCEVKNRSTDDKLQVILEDYEKWTLKSERDTFGLYKIHLCLSILQNVCFVLGVVSVVCSRSLNGYVLLS